MVSTQDALLKDAADGPNDLEQKILQILWERLTSSWDPSKYSGKDPKQAFLASINRSIDFAVGD